MLPIGNGQGALNSLLYGGPYIKQRICLHIDTIVLSLCIRNLADIDR